MREEIPYIPPEELTPEELTPEAVNKTLKEFLAAREDWEAVKKEYDQAAPKKKIEIQEKYDRIKEIFLKLQVKLKAIKAIKSFSHIQLPEDMPD